MCYPSPRDGRRGKIPTAEVGPRALIGPVTVHVLDDPVDWVWWTLDRGQVQKAKCGFELRILDVNTWASEDCM